MKFVKLILARALSIIGKIILCFLLIWILGNAIYLKLRFGGPILVLFTPFIFIVVFSWPYLKHLKHKRKEKEKWRQKFQKDKEKYIKDKIGMGGDI